jgi:hypothetical protein
MINASLCNQIFDQSITVYHQLDNVDQALDNPFPEQSIEALLFHKNWIDTVQWHLEDIVRDPNIDPVSGLALKRRIDKSNQERTDLVEYVDSYFLQLFQSVTIQHAATLNTESPAWAIDRLSILALKIYHMRLETLRSDASKAHIIACQQKLDVLLEQRKDLSAAIDMLLSDMLEGKKYMKVYKQMKMYNDPELNPVLYQTKA